MQRFYGKDKIEAKQSRLIFDNYTNSNNVDKNSNAIANSESSVAICVKQCPFGIIFPFGAIFRSFGANMWPNGHIGDMYLFEYTNSNSVDTIFNIVYFCAQT